MIVSYLQSAQKIITPEKLIDNLRCFITKVVKAKAPRVVKKTYDTLKNDAYYLKQLEWFENGYVSCFVIMFKNVENDSVYIG